MLSHSRAYTFEDGLCIGYYLNRHGKQVHPDRVTYLENDPNYRAPANQQGEPDGTYSGETFDTYTEEWLRFYNYTKVKPEENDNPSSRGWYEKKRGDYILTDDETVHKGKSYYTRSAQNPPVVTRTHVWGVGVKNKGTDNEEITRLVYPNKTYARIIDFDF